MNKKLTTLLLLLVAIITYGCYAVYSHDNRTAGNLSAYCHIDFRGVTEPQTQKTSAATLSIVDYRYGASPLEPFFGIDIDGKIYAIDDVEVSVQPPTYLPQDIRSDRFLKHTNTIFIVFPPQVLQEISQATTVKVSFKYANSPSPVTLPLSDVDLRYWKNQLPSL